MPEAGGILVRNTSICECVTDPEDSCGDFAKCTAGIHRMGQPIICLQAGATDFRCTYSCRDGDSGQDGLCPGDSCLDSSPFYCEVP